MPTPIKNEYTALNGLICEFKQAIRVCHKYNLDTECFSSRETQWLFTKIMETYESCGDCNAGAIEAVCLSGEIDTQEALDTYFKTTEDTAIVIGAGYDSAVKSLVKCKIRDIERFACSAYKSITHKSSDKEILEAKESYANRMKEKDRYTKQDVDIDTVIDELIGEINEESVTESKCDMTWLPSFDGKMYPIKPYEYIVLAARPGGGKSSMLANIAGHNLQQGKRVFIGTLEMSIKEMCELIAGQIAKINVRKKKQERDDRLKCYEEGLQGLRNLYKAGYLGLSRQVNVSKFMEELNCFSIKHGKPDVVFYDYLQYAIDSNCDKDDKRQIDAISRALKDYAANNLTPVIAAAQLNRDHTKEGKEPDMQDLKGSGNIEQDAHRIWLLHTPKKNEDGAEQYELWLKDVVFKQAKGRGAPIDRLILSFNGPQKRFYEKIKS